MNDNFFIIFMIMIFFISGMLKFLMNYRYLLINLVSIEFMMLSIFLLSYLYFLMIQYELIFLMVFLTFMVSEGVLGLSLLISMVRMFGNNYFQSMNLFLW